MPNPRHVHLAGVQTSGHEGALYTVFSKFDKFTKFAENAGQGLPEAGVRTRNVQKPLNLAETAKFG